MIENARGMIEIESIAKSGEGYLDGLLVGPSYLSSVVLIKWSSHSCTDGGAVRSRGL